ncbi:MAG: hypothetical protein GY820_12740, partial [Gammaproteobacteria bacterium]|nr:hypothetical protein [Gammaproteobacteria bacterium]
IAYEQNQKAEASSNFCGIPQQQQQPQQYNRLHEPPPYAQSQNWHPPNQSYENNHSTFGNPSEPTVRKSGGPNSGGPSYHHTGNNQGENIRSMGNCYARKTPFLADALQGDMQNNSEAPFQSDFSEMKNMFRTLSSKMDGVNQRVGNIERTVKQGSNLRFPLSRAEGNIPKEKEAKFCSTSNLGQTSVEMQGRHLLTNSVGNKQQNQHQSRKINQDCCKSASNSNRPNNNSSNTSNLDQPSANLGFRLSYLEGNVPTENHKKCAPTQIQYQTTGDNYLPKNCQKEKELQAKNYIQ